MNFAIFYYFRSHCFLLSFPLNFSYSLPLSKNNPAWRLGLKEVFVNSPLTHLYTKEQGWENDNKI